MIILLVLAILSISNDIYLGIISLKLKRKRNIMRWKMIMFRMSILSERLPTKTQDIKYFRTFFLTFIRNINAIYVCITFIYYQIDLI